MACCLYFFQGGSKTWLAFLVPIIAVIARFSSALLISVSLSAALLLFLSAVFLFIHRKQNPTMVDNSLIKQAPPLPENDGSPPPIITSTDSSRGDDLGGNPIVEAETQMKKDDALTVSQYLYSESESMDQFSSTSSEDHSSDIEWPYNMAQRLDGSDDGSISDEESLIEIAIPSGQFVSPEKDCTLKNLKCCKLSEDLSDQESMFHHKDFFADINEMNEEDNLIEIDIYMGSIKCSSFEI